jgi:Protein of unknown function (DUF642)
VSQSKLQMTQINWEQQQMNLLRSLAIALLGTLAFSAQSQAFTVFDDNFNANAVALNGTPANWTTVQGSVDLIGPSLFDLLPGNGVYVDMDGSTSAQGTISTTQSFSFQPGVTYTLSYDLAGSQRSNGNNSVDVSIPGVLSVPTQTLADSAGFQTFVQTFTVAAPILAQIVFAAVSSVSDDQGLLLDNVKLTAVPLPAAVWLMLSGIAGLGAFARRRREAAAS